MRAGKTGFKNVKVRKPWLLLGTLILLVVTASATAAGLFNATAVDEDGVLAEQEEVAPDWSSDEDETTTVVNASWQNPSPSRSYSIRTHPSTIPSLEERRRLVGLNGEWKQIGKLSSSRTQSVEISQTGHRVLVARPYRFQVYEWKTATKTWEPMGEEVNVDDWRTSYFRGADSFPISMSADGSRVVAAAPYASFYYDCNTDDDNDCGDLPDDEIEIGYVRVYGWNGTEYELLFTRLGSLAGGNFQDRLGLDVAMSENGDRFVTLRGKAKKVEFYEEDSDGDWSFVRSVVYDDISEESFVDVARGRFGLVVVATGQSVRVYRWNFSNIETVAQRNIVGAESVALSSGEHTVAVGRANDIQVFDLSGLGETKTFVRLGNPISVNGGYRMSMARGGLHVVAKNDSGAVHAYMFDGSQWVQVGGNIPTELLFSAMSRDGLHVVSSESDMVRVFRYHPPATTDWVQLGPIFPFPGPGSMTADGTRVLSGQLKSFDGYFWQPIGESIGGKISRNGLRVVSGDPQNERVFVYVWRNSQWEQLGDPILGVEPDAEGELEFGSSTSISDNGQRVVAMGDEYYYPGPEVFEFNGNRWVKMPSDNIRCYGQDFRGCRVFISGNGERVAVGYRELGTVGVYEWNGVSWEELGARLSDGETGRDFEVNFSLAMSYSGHRVVIGAPQADYVRVYEWKGSSWVQMGGDLKGFSALDDFGDFVSMSSNGLRIVVGGTRGHNCFRDRDPQLPGYVRIFDWNGSMWVPVGSTLNGEYRCDFFGRTVRMSANGERIAVRGDGYGRVYEFENTPNTGPFPANFQQVICAYQTCLGNLIPMYNNRLHVDNVRKAKWKTQQAKNLIENGGWVVGSLKALKNAMKFIELYRSVATGFSNNRGRQGCTCATSLAEGFISRFQGTGILSSSVLDNARSKLSLARNKKESKEWRLCVQRCQGAVWTMMNALEEKQVPLCGS